jgi:hypothetical protein
MSGSACQSQKLRLGAINWANLRKKQWRQTSSPILAMRNRTRLVVHQIKSTFIIQIDTLLYKLEIISMNYQKFNFLHCVMQINWLDGFDDMVYVKITVHMALMLSGWWICRLRSSALWRRVVLYVVTNVSEELIASIFRVENNSELIPPKP